MFDSNHTHPSHNSSDASGLLLVQAYESRDFFAIPAGWLVGTDFRAEVTGGDVVGWEVQSRGWSTERPYPRGTYVDIEGMPAAEVPAAKVAAALGDREMISGGLATVPYSGVVLGLCWPAPGSTAEDCAEVADHDFALRGELVFIATVRLPSGPVPFDSFPSPHYRKLITEGPREFRAVCWVSP